MNYMGLPVITSPLCVRMVPVRVHKERVRVVDYGSLCGEVPVEPGNYHARVQKKWLKRYGTRTEKVLYIATDNGRQVIVCHPDILTALRKSAAFDDGVMAHA